MAKFFAVAQERPVLGATKQFKYPTAEAAERVARRLVAMKGGEMSIWLHCAPRHCEAVAVVLRDALDRIWTQVEAAPGEPALL